MGARRKTPVDKTIHPEEECYEPPPPEECDHADGVVDLNLDYATGERHGMYWRQRIYRGRVVDFCLEQKLWTPEGDEHIVERVDTSHGTVHRHPFTRRNGRPSPVVLSHISPDRGHDEVDTAFDEEWDRLLDRWNENVRRWRGP